MSITPPEGLALFEPPETPGQRLRRLVEFHSTLERSYAANYRQAVAALAAAQELEPSSFGMTPERQEALVANLTHLRDDTAKLYSTTLARVELAVNELSPGMFDDDVPFGSDDMTDEEKKEALRDLANSSLALAAGAAVVGAEPVAAALAGFGGGIYGALAVGEFAGWW